MKFGRLNFLSLIALSLSGCLETPHVGEGFGSASFTHSTALTSCNDCHESSRPALPHVQTTDCVQCHTYTSWLTVTSFTHSPSLTSCNECHESDRPPAPHVTGTDCVSCHNYTSWAGGISFVHTAQHIQPGACSTCHAADRPSQGLWMDQAFGLAKTDSHYGVADCYACHSTTRNFQDWNSTTTSHYNAAGTKIQSCLPCHYQDKEPRLSNAPNLTNRRIGEHQNQNSYFTAPIFAINSATPSVPNATGPHGNCFSCHTTRRNF